MDRFVIISGCSGGGKSALISELARRGHDVVDEPGRRIIDEELRAGGSALPWIDMSAFARRAIEMALQDREMAMKADSRVFFDRGLIDATAALQRTTGEPALRELIRCNRYNRRVFLTPPWPEIYATDADRRHDLHTAMSEYEHLLQVYPALGYEVVVLPKVRVEERADYLLGNLIA